MNNSTQKIVVILGQTASGKSDLAIKVAQEFNGEIICADSRTIYKGMDIGTAKPSLDDQKIVPHYGLDLINPDQAFSAAEFKDYATGIIHDIHQRNNIPLVVGGTGLYIDSYVYDFSFTSQPSIELRNEINSLNLLQLQQRAKALGITEEQVSFANHRHLGRMIERVMTGEVGQTKRPKPDNILLIGLKVPREQLIDRITQRVGTIFNSGFIEEARALIQKYGADAPGLRAPGYPAVAEYINGNATLEESKEMMIRGHKQLAKRQLTWFKRNEDIVWCDTAEDGLKNIRAFLLAT